MEQIFFNENVQVVKVVDHRVKTYFFMKGCEFLLVNENTLEQAIISELHDKGYEYIYGPDIDRDYHEVILEDCFRTSMLIINPGITQDIISEAYKEIKNLGLVKLEDLNSTFHKYIIEGIPIPFQKDKENRTFTVKLIDFENPTANDFKVVNQYTIIEYKTKRPDLLVFINGIPMILLNLKIWGMIMLQLNKRMCK